MEVKKCCPNCFKREGYEFLSRKDIFGGINEYYQCKACNNDIDVYRMKKFQELINTESTRYLNQQKEKYANKRIIEELENLSNYCDDEHLYKRIKELKEVKP
jgi:hypothetical protein